MGVGLAPRKDVKKKKMGYNGFAAGTPHLLVVAAAVP